MTIGLWGRGSDHSLGLGQILWTIGIEEGIGRLAGPIHLGKAVTRGPNIHLADVILFHCLAQILLQADRPKPKDRMGAAAGRGASELRALLSQC